MTGQLSGNGLQKETPATDGGLRGELDKWRALATEREETIRDLRARLDAESEERRRVQERLTGLLTHRQAGSVPAVMPRAWAPWWRRWFR